MNPRWWTATTERDAAYDGAFVFAVTTTGIYCRPTCPARRPNRENVRFFLSPHAAEREGFRACKRCRPLSERPDASLAARAGEYLRRHVGERVTLGAMARSLGSGADRLQRTFKRTLGVTPHDYLSMLRFEEFRRRAGSDGVDAALYQSGFASSSRLYESSKARLGMSPGTFVRGGAGMTIAYAVVDCPLGRALVAATPLGLCAVSFGDSDRALCQALRKRHPKATIQKSPDLLRFAVDEIRRIFAGKTPDPALPIDVRATAFQAKVWAELRAIPAGSTRSYAEIARRIGRPTAARAVARACGSNPIALIVPCHRVVASDGSLSGYRWGPQRKKSLLESERARR